VRESVHRYLYTFDSFEMFGSQHLWALSISLVLFIAIPIYAKQKLNPSQQDRFGAVIGFLVMGNYIVWVGLELIAGTFDLKLHLPFHLCRFANLIIPFVMLKKNFRVYEVLYFWGFSGMFQAAITPDISQAFPHFHFIRFWIGHNGLILALIYATVVYEMKPTIISLKRAFIGLNAFFLLTIPVNLILDANYFWIRGKPVNDLGEHIPSLLDYLGPWPWYILSAEFVALAHFAVAYLPIYFIKKRNVT